MTLQRCCIFLLIVSLIAMSVPTDAPANPAGQNSQQPISTVKRSSAEIIQHFQIPPERHTHESLFSQINHTATPGIDKIHRRILVTPGQIPGGLELISKNSHPVKVLPDIRRTLHPSIDRDDHPATIIDEISPESNGGNSDRPLVRLKTAGIFRGIQLYVIEYAPLQRTGTEKQPEFYDDIRVKIQLEDAPATMSANRAKLTPATLRLLEYLLPQDLPLSELTGGYYPYDHLLILGPEAFLPEMDRLAEWKRQTGLDVTVKSLNETGGIREEIHSSIKEAYLEWDSPPTYVLLAGHTELIPAFDGIRYPDSTARFEYPTDLYYSTMDGPDDVIPDLFIGRLPARTVDEFADMVDKIITYELVPPEHLEDCSRGAFVATGDTAFNTFVENTHRYAIEQNLSRPGMEADSIWVASGGRTEDIINAVNSGVNILCYSAHGTEYIWQDPTNSPAVYFWQEDINSLTNQGMFPLILSFGCKAGVYGTGYPSLGESWLLAEDRGASAFWGASNLTYWYEDDYLERRFFDGVNSEALTSLGVITTAALTETAVRGYPTGPYYFEIYNLLGDPSMPVKLGARDYPPLTVPGVISPEADSVSITIGDNSLNPNSWSTLYAGDQLLVRTELHPGENILYPDQLLSDYDSVLVTVNIPNRRIYRKELGVVEQYTVTVRPDSIPVDKQSNLTVRILDSQGDPWESGRVTIDGLGLDTPVHDTTNTDGEASVTLMPQAGEDLSLTGYDEADQPVFRRKIHVYGGQLFTDTSLTIQTPELNTDGFLVPRYTGLISWNGAPADVEMNLRGIPNNRYEVSGNELTFTPWVSGEIVLQIYKSGYQLHKNRVPVTVKRESLSGILLDSLTGTPVENQEILVTPADSVIADMTVRTDSSGYFLARHPVPLGRYTLSANRQGYHKFSRSFMVKWRDTHPDTLYMNPLSPAAIRGMVMDTEGNPIAGATVRIRGQDLDTSTDEEGIFQFSGVLPDSTAVIQIASRGYRDHFDSLQVIEDDSIFGLRYRLSDRAPEKRFHFEWDAELFDLTGDWEWGPPGKGLYYRGPDSAHGGTNVIATRLDYNYTTDTRSTLTSPVIYLDNYSEVALTFHHYFSMDYINTGFDGGNVKISGNGGMTWEIIYPEGGYSVDALHSTNHYLTGEPAFSGSQPFWKEETFLLDGEWSSPESLMVRFDFASTSRVEDVGWYIDDIRIFDPGYVGVDPPGIADSFQLFQNYPNPANASTVIEFTVPERTSVTLKLYDLRGRDVTTIFSGEVPRGRFRHVEDLSRLSSGLYFVRLESREYTAIRKLMVIR
mgnify:CR=1 FL=1